MKNITRRISLLKNLALAEWAILNLKASAHDGDYAVIREAEKVVEKYMDKKVQKIREEKKSKRAVMLSLAIGFISLGIMIFMFFA